MVLIIWVESLVRHKKKTLVNYCWVKYLLIPWKESYDQPRQHIKKQRHYFVNKSPSSQGYGFSSGMYGCEPVFYLLLTPAPLWTFFTSNGQSIGASASASVFPMIGSPWCPRDSKSLLQHHSSKASILQCSAFFMVQLSHPYMTTGKS